MRYFLAVAGITLLAVSGGVANGAALLGWLLLATALVLILRRTPRRRPDRQ